MTRCRVVLSVRLLHWKSDLVLAHRMFCMKVRRSYRWCFEIRVVQRLQMILRESFVQRGMFSWNLFTWRMMQDLGHCRSWIGE